MFSEPRGKGSKTYKKLPLRKYMQSKMNKMAIAQEPLKISQNP